VAGLAVVQGHWRLTVEQHCDLILDITGVDPTADLDLQKLATVTARLEGYVGTERQQAAQSNQRTRQIGSPEPKTTTLRSRLANLLALVLPGWFGATTTPETLSHREYEVEKQYDVDRVYQLSRFFRAMVRANKTDSTTTKSNGENRATEVTSRRYKTATVAVSVTE
jgi:hypothetical protein